MKKEKYVFFEKLILLHQNDEIKEPEELFETANQPEMKKLAIFWKRCFPKEADKGAIWIKTFQKTGISSNSQKYYFYRKLQKIAAVLLILISFSVNWYLLKQEKNISEETPFVSFYAGTGEVKEFELPDHSKVWLNSGSTIFFPEKFDGKKRIVYLTGEAYFDVTNDISKQFIVNTQKANIIVYGTKFSVTAFPEISYTSAVLENGSVEMIAKDISEQSVFLKPGQEVLLSHQTGSMEIRNVNATQRTNWINGDLDFYNDPLSIITKNLERKYGVKFFFLDNTSEKTPITGDFSNSVLEDILSVIEEVGNLSIKKQNEVYFIKKK